MQGANPVMFCRLHDIDELKQSGRVFRRRRLCTVMRDATSSVQPAQHAVAMVTVVGAAAESYLLLTSIGFLRHLRCSLFLGLRCVEKLHWSVVSLCVQSAVVSLGVQCNNTMIV